MKKVAFMYYGQPRSVDIHCHWRNELINALKKTTNADFDFYYHFWDALSPSSVVIPGNDWDDYYETKRKRVEMTNTFDELVRLPPNKILSDITQLHTKYGHSNPHVDINDCYIELGTEWFENDVMKKIRHIVNMSGLDTKYIDMCNHWWYRSGANSVMSLISSGYCYNLIEESNIDYDIVIRIRSDILLNPFEHSHLVKQLTKMINDCHTVFPAPDSEHFYGHYVEVSPLSYKSTFGLVNKDFIQVTNIQGLRRWYNSWKYKLAEYISTHLINVVVLENVFEEPKPWLMPNIHNAYLEFNRHAHTEAHALVFNSRFDMNNGHLLIRRTFDEHVDWFDVSQDMWNKIHSLGPQGATDTINIINGYRNVK